MTRSNYFLVAVAVLLGAVYSYFFTDWFKVKIIQIIPQNRPMLGAIQTGDPICPVIFTFEQPYNLTEVSVYSVVSLKTNKASAPIWKLTTKKSSKPVRGFAFGRDIAGMTEVKDKVTHEPLVANFPYRIVVTSGKARGEADFVPVESSPPE